MLSMDFIEDSESLSVVGDVREDACETASLASTSKTNAQNFTKVATAEERKAKRLGDEVLLDRMTAAIQNPLDALAR